MVPYRAMPVNGCRAATKVRSKQYGFFIAFDSAYETVQSQILSSSKLPSLQDVYFHMLHVDSLSQLASTPNTSALVGRDPTDNMN